MLRLVLFILPLGLDTLGIAVSLGIKSHRSKASSAGGKRKSIPQWLITALLFSSAETVMPLVGLGLGVVLSLLISGVMRFIGPVLLIGIGIWEVWGELAERVASKKSTFDKTATPNDLADVQANQFDWRRQFLLALSISLDELAVGFSLGSVSSTKSVSPFLLCVLIGVQGFLLTLVGITLGRMLRARLQAVKDWSEILSGFLLIGLGAWLFFT